MLQRLNCRYTAVIKRGLKLYNDKVDCVRAH